MLKKIYLFYYEGFTNMSKSGKKLWLIIILKLIIMFAILKLFFFENFLNSQFNTDEEKIEYVSKQLTKIKE
ncbi:MAG: DUF4492 domain-containing protein [Bacteroidales bacterium]|nr:DUF4492 domain-containing protein [Bacteroidales bacterium]MBN2758443.1 DUF4492 domain-containing protein [Bacteroidales bacterium]